MAPQALYQVVLLGAGRATHGPAFRTRLEALAADIGDDVRAALRVFEPSQIGSIVPTAPLVAVYFGGDPSVDEDEAARLCAAAVPIVPVVDDLADYPAKTPAALHPVNGMAIGTIAVDYTAVVNVVLENLALLRRSRRLFLSYLRKESSAVAHQLRVAFDDGGYDTFLDLSSVPKSDDFQAVLWHRLLDSDVLIVLDTPNFLSSKWTRQELAQAAAMSVGMLRVVWPDIDTKDEAVAPLAEVLYLDGADFDGDHLTADALRRVTRATEALRARCIAARHDNLVVEFCAEAKRIGATTAVQPDRTVVTRLAGGRTIAAIPMVGVPDAQRYHELDRLFPATARRVDEAVLVYDHRGMLPAWTMHLAWLDGYLPIRSLRVTDTAASLAKP